MMMTRDGFDKSWEENVYSQSKAVNRYPFGELVPHVMRRFAKRLRSGEELKALELGSGTGNNLAFLAAEGFDCAAIDGSESACEISRQFLNDRNLHADIRCADFAAIPFEDNSFDFVLDRQAICCQNIESVRKVSSEVYRVLKPGGHFLSFAYSIEHGSLQDFKYDRVGDGTYTNFSGGPFHGLGRIHFFNNDEILYDLFRGFDVEYIHHHRNDFIYPRKTNEYAEFITLGRKPEKAN